MVQIGSKTTRELLDYELLRYKAIKDIGGTMTEDLPKPEKSIKQVEKEQLKKLKDKNMKLMLDE